MSRKASEEPWLHQASGFWCATMNGKRTYLSRDYHIAVKTLRQHQRKKRSQCPDPDRDWWGASFAELADEYLEDVKASRAPRTYRNNRERLARALRVLGLDIRVGQLKRLHLSKINQYMTRKYSSATIRDTIAPVQGVLIGPSPTTCSTTARSPSTRSHPLEAVSG
jgi:hypothetical protein